MGYAVYRCTLNYEGEYRFCGYGVPAYCEHPDCNKEIHRGMGYACGGAPDAEGSCTRYFCEKHGNHGCYISPEGEHCNDLPDDANEDDYEYIHSLCERCAKEEEPFPIKDEHPEWLEHVLNDETWEKWRKEEPKVTKKYQELLNTKKNL